MRERKEKEKEKKREKIIITLKKKTKGINRKHTSNSSYEVKRGSRADVDPSLGSGSERASQALNNY